MVPLVGRQDFVLGTNAEHRLQDPGLLNHALGGRIWVPSSKLTRTNARAIIAPMHSTPHTKLTPTRKAPKTLSQNRSNHVVRRPIPPQTRSKILPKCPRPHIRKRAKWNTLKRKSGEDLSDRQLLALPAAPQPALLVTAPTIS